MVGGLGTRLRPLTCKVPKPMLPVANRPILEHTLNLLKKHRLTDIIFLLYYQPEYIRDYFGDGTNHSVNISYVASEADYGTAGAVKQAAHLVDESFMVISGDAVTDLDLTRFMQFHREKRALISLALSHVENPSPFGIALTNSEGRITRFLEKPSWGQIFSDSVNMGVYVLQPAALEHIPPKQEYYFSRDLFPNLLRKDLPLFGFIDDCYWKDIGSLSSYQQVHFDFFEKKIELELKEPESRGVWRGRHCQIGKNVRFEGAVILGDNCRVESGVELVNTVVGEGSVIGQNSKIENSVLWQEVQIDKGSEILRAVVGSQTRIGEQTVVAENVIISDHTQIGSQSQINANVKIWPDKEVDVGSVVNSSLVWGEKWQRELFTDARVTGLANYEVSPEFGAKLGAAFGAWLGKEHSVMVSRDATPASRMIARAMVCGLMSAGVNVHSLQVMPIPIARYALRSGRENGGVHVRRSPFDRKLIDILFFDDNGRDFSPATTRTFERIFFREDFPRVAFDEVGKIQYPVRVAESYMQDFLAHINVPVIDSAKFKVVIDYSYGAATQIFPTILGKLGCEITALNAYLDAEKITRTPRKFEQALEQLSKVVKVTGADVGFLIDAGAEVIRCVDEKGRIIPPERLAVLVTKLYFDSMQPQKIAVPVSVPHQIELFAREKNIDIEYTADNVGAIIKATEDSDVSLALDIKGGFIFTDFHFAYDGMFTLVKILEHMARSNISLGKLHETVPQRAFRLESIPCPWEVKGKVFRHLTADSEQNERLIIDGVKVLFDDAWVLVLPDRDKAFCHVLAEASHDRTAKKLVEQYKRKILNWIRM